MIVKEFKIDETVIKINDEDINKEESEDVVNTIVSMILKDCKEESWKILI